MIDTVTGLASPWAYVVIAVLVALEASAFVGLFIPGELALLAGGSIVYQGHARLDVMMAVAVVAAIAGDSAGYEIGRHLGGRLRTGAVGRRIGAERWDRAETALDAHGGRSVLIGRFVGILRALVPAMAGAARMPYGRFLAWNAVGALIWAPGMILAGYVAGSSYRRVERYAGRAGLLLVVLAVLVAAVVLTARWIGRHQDELHARLRRQLDRPRIAALRARYRSQLAFVGRRLTPGGALGLALSVQLLILALGGWLFAGVLQDVIGRDDLARFDLPVTRYVVAHRTAWLTTAMQALTWLGSSTVLMPILVAAGIAWRIRRHTWSPLVFLGAAQLGAIALYDLVKVLVARPRPEIGDMVATATGYAFPSGHATQSVAVWGALALVLLPQLPRSRQITVGAVAATVALLVGLSRVYLGVHWTTDVVGGWVLGALWLSALVLARRTFRSTDLSCDAATPTQSERPSTVATREASEPLPPRLDPAVPAPRTRRRRQR